MEGAQASVWQMITDRRNVADIVRLYVGSFAEEEACVEVAFSMSYRRHDTVSQPYKNCVLPSCLPRRVWDDNIETNEKDADVKRVRTTICSICLESFVLGDQVTQFLCAHPLHFECARQWFIWCLVQNHARKCPVCNTIVVAVRSSWPPEYDSMGTLRRNYLRRVAPVPTPRVSTDLVIAHCTEDTSWIPSWIEKLNLSHVYIYTKCGAPVPRDSAVVRVTPLINKGREGQSWLHHLLRTDIVFADQSVFVQGSPEVTLNAVLLRLKSRDNRFIDFGTWSPSTYVFPGCVTSHSEIEGELRARYQEWKPRASNISFESIRCTLRGEFSVSRAVIQGFLHRHTRRGLERLKQETEAGDAPLITFVLERLWGTLFSSDSIDFTLNK